MSVWSWKKSEWINSTLAVCLIAAVFTGIGSAAIRTGFQVLTTHFKFYGGVYPEIGLFNILLYVSALFGFVSVTYRYSYIDDQSQIMPPVIAYLNKISISTGILSFIGLILIASFTVSNENEGNTFQSTGAYIFIGGGLVFIILQTILTYVIIKYSPMFFFRLSLVLLLMSTFVTSLIFIQEDRRRGNLISEGNNSTEKTTLDTVNNEQMITCALEWSCVVLYALYFLSFFRDFRNVSSYVILRPVIVPALNDLRSSPITVVERV